MLVYHAVFVNRYTLLTRKHRPYRILTNDDVELIRQLREDYGLSYRKIADKFEIAVSTVCDICKYRRR